MNRVRISIVKAAANRAAALPSLGRTCRRVIVVRSGFHELSESLLTGNLATGSVIKIIGVSNPPPIISYTSKGSNKPLLHIESGSVVLQNLDLRHHCRGTDIWEGNAVVHLRPVNSGATSARSVAQASLRVTNLQPDLPLVCQLPRLFAYGCTLNSTSGRGVAATAAQAYLDNTAIVKCAATGVYLGRGSSRDEESYGSLVAMRCDFSGNGIGGKKKSHETHSIVQRGHSGVYGQEGQIVLYDCDISTNKFTGVR